MSRISKLREGMEWESQVAKLLGLSVFVETFWFSLLSKLCPLKLREVRQHGKNKQLVGARPPLVCCGLQGPFFREGTVVSWEEPGF